MVSGVKRATIIGRNPAGSEPLKLEENQEPIYCRPECPLPLNKLSGVGMRTSDNKLRRDHSTPFQGLLYRPLDLNMRQALDKGDDRRVIQVPLPSAIRDENICWTSAVRGRNI